MNMAESFALCVDFLTRTCPGKVGAFLFSICSIVPMEMELHLGIELQQKTHSSFPTASPYGGH